MVVCFCWDFFGLSGHQLLTDRSLIYLWFLCLSLQLVTILRLLLLLSRATARAQLIPQVSCNTWAPFRLQVRQLESSSSSSSTAAAAHEMALDFISWHSFCWQMAFFSVYLLLHQWGFKWQKLHGNFTSTTMKPAVEDIFLRCWVSHPVQQHVLNVPWNMSVEKRSMHPMTLKLCPWRGHCCFHGRQERHGVLKIVQVIRMNLPPDVFYFCTFSYSVIRLYLSWAATRSAQWQRLCKTLPHFNT